MASGDTLLIFTSLQNEPPGGNAAVHDDRNQHPVLDFEDSDISYAMFTGILPNSYSGGALDIFIHWAASSATSGNVRWQTEIERIGEGVQDIDSDSFATIIAGNYACPGTSGHVEINVNTHTSGANMDNLVKGEAFRLRVGRDGANAADTMAGDAELLLVEIREV